MIKCKNCGVDNQPNASECMGCGHRRMSAYLRLVSVSDPTIYIETRMTLDVGRQLLKRFGSDYQFADNLQFHIIRDEAAGVWRIRPVATAKNPTHWNGELMPYDGTDATPGGVVSLPKGKLEMTVEQEAH